MYITKPFWLNDKSLVRYVFLSIDERKQCDEAEDPHSYSVGKRAYILRVDAPKENAPVVLSGLQYQCSIVNERTKLADWRQLRLDIAFGGAMWYTSVAFAKILEGHARAIMKDDTFAPSVAKVRSEINAGLTKTVKRLAETGNILTSP